MKVTAFIRETSAKNNITDQAHVYFRVRDGKTDIKAVSELSINPNHWSAERQGYKTRVALVAEAKRTAFDKAVQDLTALISAQYYHGADSRWLKGVIEEFHHPNINIRQGRKGDEYSLVYQCQQYAENHPMEKESIRHHEHNVRKLQHFERFQREIMRRRGYAMRLDAITADDLREFHKYLVNEAGYYEHYPQIFDDIEERFKPRQLTENSINTIFRRIRTVVNWCLKHNITTNDPFATFEMPKVLDSPPFYLTLEEQGTGVKGVFWDPEAHGGLGEIAIRPMNLLMLYWEPGVEDIQASPNFFSLRMENTKQLETRWPQLKGHSASVLDVPRFLHDGGLDTTEKSVVVDWYYKKPDAEGRVLLHYCKFCNGVVLYASENDPALAGRGFYDHGKYPFVFDPLFMEEDSPAGFGYIDVMKECQTAIDRMNHAMDENVLLASKQRYVLSDTAGVNEEELADLSRDIVHVVGRLGDDSFRPLQTAGLQGNSLSYRNSRIEELKEISGNRDMTQGGTAGGVTAASAIAALQEAGSKLSRDMLKSAYRAFARECYLILDLMRQFYDEERVFRIVGAAGQNEFVPFSGAALRPQPAGTVGGVELGSREPVFDIVVSAEKKSTFSRLSQNETAKECYQLGFFAPANADAALAALEMMDFEGIEKVRQRVRQNGTLAMQLAVLQSRLTAQEQPGKAAVTGPADNLSTKAAADAMGLGKENR